MADQETASDQGTERSEAPSETAPSPSARDEAPEQDATPASSDTSWLASDRAQTLANVLTIIVALAAIGLSVWEGLENRWHNRLSVLPHLDPVDRTQRKTDSTYMVRLAIENTGLGPAVLENFIYFRGSKKIHDAKQSDELYALFSEIGSALDQLPFDCCGHGTYQLDAGEMVKADEEHLLIQIEVPQIDTVWAPGIVRDSVFSTRSFALCYCSVYGTDCDMAFLGAEPPVEDVCGF